jgi:rifampin ADP-ribosylating transferase
MASFDWAALDAESNSNLNPVQFHGTRAVLSSGDYIEPGHPTNYPERDPDDDQDSHVYTTPRRAKAAQFAYQAKGVGKPRVYQVEPTGHMGFDEETQPEDFKSDRAMEMHGSRRSQSPLKVVKEVRASVPNPHRLTKQFGGGV